MTADEQALIARLFERLGGLAGLSHDAAAMRFSAEQLATLPDGPGLAAQVLLAQEAAIASLRARLSALERERAAEAAWQVGAARYLTLQVANMPAIPAPDGSFLQGVFAAAAGFASGRLLMDSEMAASVTQGQGGEFTWSGPVTVGQPVPEEDFYALKGNTDPPEPPPE